MGTHTAEVSHRSQADADPVLDARVARSRAAVIHAATELLVQGGPNAVTVDAVVAESGVAKSTIYRHWRSRDELLIDVFRACAPANEPDAAAATFADALESFVDDVVDNLNDERWARVIPALLMLRVHEPQLLAMSDELNEQQDGLAAHVLQQGIKEGVLEPDIDPGEAATTLLGPLLFAHLTGTVEVDRAFGRRVAHRFRQAYARR
jgi:AcrR family transcriptional regulator